MAGTRRPHTGFVKQGLPKKGGDAQSQDQIASDLGKIKEATKKVSEQVTGKLKTSVYPKVSEGAPVVFQAGKSIGSSISSFTSSETLKNVLKTAAAIISLIVFFFIGIRVVNMIMDGSGNGEVSLTTPTPVPYTPYKPSIYAEDEMVLKMEEDIKVLEKETSTVVLKETSLTPPVLDFDISFEE